MEVPADLQNRYLERRRRNLLDCLQCLEKENFQEIEKIGHQLKGNASTFGYPELGVVGEKLEKAAIKQDWRLIRTILFELFRWIDKKFS